MKEMKEKHLQGMNTSTINDPTPLLPALLSKVQTKPPEFA